MSKLNPGLVESQAPISTGCETELSLVRSTRGLSSVEYIILLGLIAAFAFSTWQNFGEKIEAYVTAATNTIEPLGQAAAGG